MLSFLQRIGKSLMLPIAVLPAAGLVLRFGQEDLLNIPFIANAGSAVLTNLAIIFAIGVAIGFSKDGNGAAGLAGAIGYFILTEGAKSINPDINMSVLGGIIAGVIAGLLYNRFHDIKLPEWLAFFGGKRFVPIITAVVMVLLSGVAGFVWPPIQDAINNLGNWMIDLGAVGAGIFGFFNRLLIPIGLHHVLNNIFWFQFGEFEGSTGDISRFFAGDPSAGMYMTGFFPIMMFALPGAALAMILTAKREKKKLVTGMFASLALTSFVTGVTEPIEFSFMFLSPLLYGVHAVLTGLSLWLTTMLGIRDGFTFSAGAIDYLLNFGIADKPLLLLLIGLIYGVLYFVIFYFLIKALDLKTPGREDDDEMIDSTEESTGSNTRAHTYISALGGEENIVSIDHCATRLRLNLKNTSLMDEEALKRAGARGVIKVGESGAQVIIGPSVEFIAEEIKKEL
ncbi:N-acetylglucosamine-specific PTS transporter subunit IIBC [Metabacillus fastidiosus]|uniref:N-acetylglucosamine-specific PTS transporter subunit IIBC n=1 Tax=Metabacillus fastidiosus TaxID=1458 RepID=UPI002DB81A0B|nr:N-acetylglucosamine-specific PTS transporter subunit IIBC [Metabacillus fastidiosus]MEC2075331.1 N-acetylglucosamine-specific PTS transporter subunit IIBC [Metabacillus fastidiosus]